jgi:hypothetical protein
MVSSPISSGSDGSSFWKAATLAIPSAMALAVFVFAFTAGVVDESSSTATTVSRVSSLGLVLGVPLGVLVLTCAGLALRRTPKTRGALLGVSTVCVLVIYVWVALA